jgi:DNA polymerase-3 subunit delta'
MESQNQMGLEPKLLARVRRIDQSRGLAHAYILSGPDRQAMARVLAACYVCAGRPAPCGSCAGCRKTELGIHPDVISAGEDGKDITVSTVRTLRADAYIRPNEAPRKVYLLYRAEHMNPSAQNALLKLLEEGPAYAAFLLVAENELALLPTVRSRCELIRTAGPEEQGESAELEEKAVELAQLLTCGSEGARMEYAVGLEKWDRDQLSALLGRTVDLLRDKLVEQKADRRVLLAAVDHLQRLQQVCSFNVGVGHLAGWLAAGFTQKECPAAPF